MTSFRHTSEMLKGRVNIGNKETTDNFYWMSQKKSFED